MVALGRNESSHPVQWYKTVLAAPPTPLPRQALVMLHLWVQNSGPRATGNNLERALKQIGRDDVIARCMHNIKEVTDVEEKAAARVYLDGGKANIHHVGILRMMQCSVIVVKF